MQTGRRLGYHGFTPMRKLILIKHAKPVITDQLPTHEWALSEEGRRACVPLADAVRPHQPAAIVTSAEPKAHETARLVGEALGISVETHADLREHDRNNVPMMPPREFLSLMALFFKQRRRLVLGQETADAVGTRFANAIDAICQSRAEGNIAIVTHGTVLALFAAEHGGGDPFLLFRRMGLPSLMTFSLPEYLPLEVVQRIPP